MDMYEPNNDNANTPSKKKLVHYFIPVTIIITSIIISGAIVMARNGVNVNNVSKLDRTQFAFGVGAPENIRAVSVGDHILGNPSAPVKIVEFSDFECPFCKIFQEVMWSVMDTYGKDGRVAWIYRHLPIDSIHSKARIEATAAECAGEIGGNDAFWDYADQIFEITPSNDNLNLALLPQIAVNIGVDKTAFEECLASERYDDHIEADFLDAIDSGANGTPYSVVIAPNGKTFTLSGAQPYSVVSAVVDLALREK